MAYRAYGNPEAISPFRAYDHRGDILISSVSTDGYMEVRAAWPPPVSMLEYVHAINFLIRSYILSFTISLSTSQPKYMLWFVLNGLSVKILNFKRLQLVETLQSQ